MSQEPLVSVIIAFLNAEKYFTEAIESVFNQTYTNWELVLIDDGSTDESTKIAIDYAKKYPDKVHYFQHEGHQNRGISASRNLGVKNAKGKYIATLDADDKWIEKKLEEQVEILKTNKEAAMVYGTTKYWYSWTGSLDDEDKDFIIDLKIKTNTIYKPPTLLTLTLESETITGSMSSIMIRSDIVAAVGGFEDSFTGMHEDQAFLGKIYANYSVYISDACWDMYRQHPDSLCNIATKEKQDRSTELFYLNWLENYVQKNGVEDPELIKALLYRKWKFKHATLSTIKDSYYNTLGNFKYLFKQTAKKRLPESLNLYFLKKLKGEKFRPPVGSVEFGELRRLKPISECWGEDRGIPIDRYYIEKFIEANSDYIKGRVLEIGDDRYTQKFGKNSVTRSDILNLEMSANPETTIVADLASAPQIPSDTFDCIIFTQTLQLIYDMHSTIETLYRILKRGGVMLVTVSGISQTTDDQTWDRNWCWRFTSVSVEKLFGEKFPPENLEVKGFGNVLVAASFLYGLSTNDLKQQELDYYDHRYEILITARAVKPS